MSWVASTCSRASSATLCLPFSCSLTESARLSAAVRPRATATAPTIAVVKSTAISSNGTTVNGQPLDRGQPRLLRAGDVIGLAPDVTLRFGA